jgi:hypothetical protein
MESPEELEKALSCLMPAALSESGRRSLDELIDGLAAGQSTAAAPAPPSRPWAWAAGIATAAAALVFAVTLSGPAVVPEVAGPQAAAASVVRIGHSERVETAVPEDWVSESHGVAHRAWRVRVVDEERLRDVQTGYEVLVSRPREEVVLMPVTAF